MVEVIIEARERADTAFVRGIFQGVIVYRWLTLAYATIGVIVSSEHLVYPTAAGLLLGLAFVYTAATTVLFRRNFAVLTNPAIVVIEFAIGVILLIGDGVVYGDTRPQSLPWAWPAASLISASVVFGARVGVILALALGIASFIGEGLNAGGPTSWGVAASSKTGLYALVAAISGYLAKRLRSAEQQVSVARAREEVARTLHDGVLQTLAVVQRRSDDPELAELAAEQDRELRTFLFGARAEVQPLGVALRDAGQLVERRHGQHAQFVLADDLPGLTPEKVHALVGAVSEALTNAAKHSDAARLVVYAEPDEDSGGVFCSVRDDGRGFDPTLPHEGQGLRRSIHQRIADVGGRVEITSRPDWGTEVRLWVS